MQTDPSHLVAVLRIANYPLREGGVRATSGPPLLVIQAAGGQPIQPTSTFTVILQGGQSGFSAGYAFRVMTCLNIMLLVFNGIYISYETFPGPGENPGKTGKGL
jgi:hypothetical protein